VGAPFFQLPVGRLFGANIGLRGGVAPVRAYLPDLLADVLAGLIHPGRVFDLELPLSEVAGAYRAHGRAARHQGPAPPPDGRP
jgi:hypothetical protein